MALSVSPRVSYLSLQILVLQLIKHQANPLWLASTPTEVLDEILSYLEPLDRFAAKVSCRKLLCTRGSLQEITKYLKEDNPWEYFLARAWVEDPNAQHLLCVTCRKTHPRDRIPETQRSHHALERTCFTHKSAIELGSTRLTSAVIMLVLRHPQPQIANEPRKYPSIAFQDEIIGGAESVGHTHFGSYPTGKLHSPFQYTDRLYPSQVNIQQYLTRENGKVELFCQLDLGYVSFYLRYKLFEDIFPSWLEQGKDYGLQDTISLMQISLDEVGDDEEWVDGGIWICPHLPCSGRTFCLKLIQHLRQARDTEKSQEAFKCAFCHTEMKFQTSVNSREYDDRLGDDEIFSVPTIVHLRKQLGSFSSYTDLEHNLEFYQHFSARLGHLVLSLVG